jgi:predicted lipoprotein with Yx(FWY)xxD motif
MRKWLLIVPLALAAVALAAGCGSNYDQAAAPATTAATPAASGGSGAYGAPATPAPAAAATVAKVSTASGDLGTFLVGPDGRTLYLFEKDTGTASTCSGACADAWPPLTTGEAPTAGGAAKAALLGTTKRADGTMEVTYAGHPLYYFAGDTAAGDTNGEGVDHFGAEWYMVSPAGATVEEDEGS